jgi:nucleoporin NDC1
MAAIVLGQPYGDVGIIVDAIDGLTRFAVCSLKEDKYGNVQRDVKLIIRTFTTTVTKLEKFKQDLGVHWTDVEKKQQSPEADAILVALKGGLSQLVEAFGDYSEDLRLSQSEMRMAREAATPAPAPASAPVRPEMEQRK